MSLAVNGLLTPVKVEDSRLNFDHAAPFGVSKGGVNNTYRVLPGI